MFSEVFVGKQMDFICWEDSCGEINGYTDIYGGRKDAFTAVCCPLWPEHVNCKIVYMEWIRIKKKKKRKKNSYFGKLFEEKTTSHVVFHVTTDNSTLKEEKGKGRNSPGGVHSLHPCGFKTNRSIITCKNCEIMPRWTEHASSEPSPPEAGKA